MGLHTQDGRRAAEIITKRHVGVRPVMCFTYGAHEEILEEHQDRLGVPTHGVALLADRDEVRKD